MENEYEISVWKMIPDRQLTFFKSSGKNLIGKTSPRVAVIIVQNTHDQFNKMGLITTSIYEATTDIIGLPHKVACQEE